jgi:hypothetical protein
MIEQPAEKSPDRKISDAMRIEEFLNDEVIREAISNVEKRFTEQMIQAETSEQRAKAQGKILAIRAFAQELVAIRDTGEMEAALATVKAKKAELKASLL